MTQLSDAGPLLEATTGGAAGGSSPAAIAAAIRSAATRVGVDVVLLADIAQIESSLNPTIKSKSSTAFGLFQFLDASWADVVSRHGAALGVLVGDRADVDAQCLMGAAFLHDNAAALHDKLGRAPSGAECYAAHFLGAPTAVAFLSHPADTAADRALGPQATRVIDANPTIFHDQGKIRTVGGVMSLFQALIDRAFTTVHKTLGL